MRCDILPPTIPRVDGLQAPLRSFRSPHGGGCGRSGEASCRLHAGTAGPPLQCLTHGASRDQGCRDLLPRSGHWKDFGKKNPASHTESQRTRESFPTPPLGQVQARQLVRPLLIRSPRGGRFTAGRQSEAQLNLAWRSSEDCVWVPFCGVCSTPHSASPAPFQGALSRDPEWSENQGEQGACGVHGALREGAGLEGLEMERAGSTQRRPAGKTPEKAQRPASSLEDGGVTLAGSPQRELESTGSAGPREAGSQHARGLLCRKCNRTPSPGFCLPC